MTKKQPALTEYPNGDKAYYLDEKLHREDGPAFVRANGEWCWFLNGKICRQEDGPAYIIIKDYYGFPQQEGVRSEDPRLLWWASEGKFDEIQEVRFVTNPDLLRLVLRQPKIKLVIDAIENPSITPELLEAASKHEHALIRSCVALNPRTPLKALIALASDSDVYVRRNLASRTYTPIEVLTILSKDTDESVSSLALQNESFRDTVIPTSSDFATETTRKKDPAADNKRDKDLSPAKQLYEEGNLTVKEIAQRLGRSESSIYKEADKGKWKRRRAAK